MTNKKIKENIKKRKTSPKKAHHGHKSDLCQRCSFLAINSTSQNLENKSNQEDTCPLGPDCFPFSEGVQLFTEFARKHHAAENIEFWLAVKEFRKKQLSGERLNEATRRIYRTFVCNQSEKQVRNKWETSEIQARIVKNVRNKWEWYEKREKQVRKVQKSWE